MEWLVSGIFLVLIWNLYWLVRIEKKLEFMICMVEKEVEEIDKDVGVMEESVGSRDMEIAANEVVGRNDRVRIYKNGSLFHVTEKGSEDYNNALMDETLEVKGG